MVRDSMPRKSVSEGRPVLKPLFAGLFAIALTMPGCGRESPQPQPVRGPRIGQPAPDIVGVDLEGESFKLSDYRGKIVVVSYWAQWCKYCVDLFPHEKALVEKFKDQPVVLIGVNGDPTIERGKASQDKHQLTWRSFWVGDPEGPVPTEWGVDGWPTTFIIDANGVLRHRFVGPQPQHVEHAVERLLREMETVRKE